MNKRDLEWFIRDNLDYTFESANEEYPAEIDIDYDGLADAVRELYNSPETVKIMAENAHRYGEENYSSTLSTGKFMAIFEKIGRKK